MTVVEVLPVTGSVVTVVDCAGASGSAGTVVVVVVLWAISAVGISATAAAIIRVRIISPIRCRSSGLERVAVGHVPPLIAPIASTYRCVGVIRPAKC